MEMQTVTNRKSPSFLIQHITSSGQFTVLFCKVVRPLGSLTQGLAPHRLSQ